MVSLWYPALLPSAAKAPYVSKELSTAIHGKDELSTVRTNSTVDAPALPAPRPLVVLSPGFGLSRATLTALGEDLAARGYLVAALDHTYEGPVEFPDGTLEQCLICEKADHAAVVRNRVKDISFLLDRLTAPDSGLPVDRDRIAVAGHSIGGAAAVEALGEDPRVDAAVNMDGDFLTPPPTTPVTRPVLLLGAARAKDPQAQVTWDERWTRLAGWRRWLDLPDAGHLSFCDLHWVADHFDVSHQIPPEETGPVFGTLRGERTTALTRAYVAAFLDQHLRDRPTSLFDRPAPAYPEVTVFRK
ncbi:alpha/beta hydrolase family protein [Streptomyces sp. URMC 123]|uniref:alpha/beta hydrolase family protein n=1 Tax=Streptomyces sp. URMC 123 TaxID=3423403 RepID=UPI003F1CAB42